MRCLTNNRETKNTKKTQLYVVIWIILTLASWLLFYAWESPCCALLFLLHWWRISAYFRLVSCPQRLLLANNVMSSSGQGIQQKKQYTWTLNNKYKHTHYSVRKGGTIYISLWFGWTMCMQTWSKLCPKKQNLNRNTRAMCVCEKSNVCVFIF